MVRLFKIYLFIDFTAPSCAHLLLYHLPNMWNKLPTCCLSQWQVWKLLNYMAHRSPLSHTADWISIDGGRASERPTDARREMESSWLFLTLLDFSVIFFKCVPVWWQLYWARNYWFEESPKELCLRISDWPSNSRKYPALKSAQDLLFTPCLPFIRHIV